MTSKEVKPSHCSTFMSAVKLGISCFWYERQRGSSTLKLSILHAYKLEGSCKEDNVERKTHLKRSALPRISHQPMFISKYNETSVLKLHFSSRVPLSIQYQRNNITQRNNIPIPIKSNNLGIVPPILNNLGLNPNPQPLLSLLG